MSRKETLRELKNYPDKDTTEASKRAKPVYKIEQIA